MAESTFAGFRRAVVHYVQRTPASSWLAVVGALGMIASAVAIGLAGDPGARPWGFTLYVLWYLAIALFLHSHAWYVKAPGLLMLAAATALVVLVGIPRYGVVTWFSAVGLLNIITMVAAVAELVWPRRSGRPLFAHQ